MAAAASCWAELLSNYGAAQYSLFMVLAAELYVNLDVTERLSHVDFRIKVLDYLPICFVYCL
jgi:hypothetical protein